MEKLNITYNEIAEEMGSEALYKEYQFTRNYSGVKVVTNDGHTQHCGVISWTVKVKKGVIIRTDICEYKHSGKHQYFLADANWENLKKLDGHKARKYFKD